MQDELKKRITERLAALKLAREQMVAEFNNRLAPYNAVIAELELLIAPEKVEGKDDETKATP